MLVFVLALSILWVALAWFVSGLAVRNGARRLPWFLFSLFFPFVTVFWFSWIGYLRARAAEERRRAASRPCADAAPPSPHAGAPRT